MLGCDLEEAAELQKNPHALRDHHEALAKYEDTRSEIDVLNQDDLRLIARALLVERDAACRFAARWKRCAKMLLDRSRSLAATVERVRRGGFTDKTLNEIEQDKREREAEEEHQRLLTALAQSSTAAGIAGIFGARQRRRNNFDY